MWRRFSVELDRDEIGGNSTCFPGQCGLVASQGVSI